MTPWEKALASAARKIRSARETTLPPAARRALSKIRKTPQWARSIGYRNAATLIKAGLARKLLIDNKTTIAAAREGMAVQD